MIIFTITIINLNSKKLDLSGSTMTGDINYKGKISTSPAILL